MKTRLITALIMIALCVVVLIFSHNPLVMSGVVALVIAGGIYELFGATGFRKKKIPAIILNVILPFVVFFEIPAYKFILLGAFVLAIVLFGYFMVNVKRLEKINDFQSVVISFLIAFLLKSVPALRLHGGLLLLIVAVLVGVMTDTGAYICGRLFGKHKLAPTLSPKKTIEGAIGGIVFAVVTVLGVLFAVGQSENIWVVVIYSLFGSVISQFGDLALSSIKRIAKIKDYGNLFPGHGGFLDRFDSLMFVIPYTYLFLIVAAYAAM